jgi:predicted DNA-binding transcriptional regulator AlpA
MLETQRQGQQSRDTLRERLPQGLSPIGLSRKQAAAYFGISPTLFDRMVRDRLAPKPARIYGRVLWDRHKLDLAFAALSDGPREAGRQDVWDRMAV